MINIVNDKKIAIMQTGTILKSKRILTTTSSLANIINSIFPHSINSSLNIHCTTNCGYNKACSVNIFAIFALCIHLVDRL